MRDLPWSEIFERIIIPACIASLKMLVLTFICSAVLGLGIAIVLYISSEQGLHPNKTLYRSINAIISIIRSFPFIVLMVSIIPLTRLISGSSIGWNAALVPLTFAATPFMARMYENSLKEVKPSLIEAAKSFGASDFQIIFGVLIVDAMPSLISVSVLSVIQVLNLTAVAGAIGGGGLGASALQYGYQTSNMKVMYSVVVVLVLWVMIIQATGDYIYKKFK